jgi:hypothetical protein
MQPESFDALTRRAADGMSRRDVLRALVLGVGTALTQRLQPLEAAAVNVVERVTGVQMGAGALQTAPYTCPTGGGYPEPKDPGIPSGGKCRDACGEDCPSTCRTQPTQKVCFTEQSTGRKYSCTYPGVILCGTHIGCQIHDRCYDGCASLGSPPMRFLCRKICDLDCLSNYPPWTCGQWAFGFGPFTDYIRFSDPPAKQICLPDHTCVNGECTSKTRQLSGTVSYRVTSHDELHEGSETCCEGGCGIYGSGIYNEQAWDYQFDFSGNVNSNVSVSINESGNIASLGTDILGTGTALHTRMTDCMTHNKCVDSDGRYNGPDYTGQTSTDLLLQGSADRQGQLSISFYDNGTYSLSVFYPSSFGIDLTGYWHGRFSELGADCPNVAEVDRTDPLQSNLLDYFHWNTFTVAGVGSVNDTQLSGSATLPEIGAYYPAQPLKAWGAKPVVQWNIQLS